MTQLQPLTEAEITADEQEAERNRFVPKQKPGRSKQNYSTPEDLILAVKSRFRIKQFALDLAADATNTKAKLWLGPGSPLNLEDSLGDVDWGVLIGDGFAWLNPPFMKIEPWARKCAETCQDSRASIAFLVPASVGSNWFLEHVFHQATVLFLNGRPHFMADRPKWGYPKDCMLALYGRRFRGGRFNVWKWK